MRPARLVLHPEETGCRRTLRCPRDHAAPFARRRLRFPARRFPFAL